MLRVAPMLILVFSTLFTAPLAAEAHLRTAKALGLTIPQSLLVRADEVIQ